MPLPADTKPDRRTAVSDERSIPAGLQSHATKAGVRGPIHMLEDGV